MKRLISLLLVLVMLAIVVTPCLAVEQDTSTVTPRYAYIAANSVYFTINESTNVTTSDVFCRTYDNYEIQIVCQLQRYNNSKWNTVKTWTSSGMKSATLVKSWAVPSGYTYRAYVTFYIYNNNGTLIETATNSNSKYFPAN